MYLEYAFIQIQNECEKLNLEHIGKSSISWCSIYVRINNRSSRNEEFLERRVIALVVILLIYLQDKSIRSSYSTTYIIIALTCGLLLGWSIGSVLQQVFFIRTVVNSQQTLSLDGMRTMKLHQMLALKVQSKSLNSMSGMNVSEY
ncbi:unnamed protein product [Thelazia callipaeda]|uniref:ABC transmembrane type-1 domain-containing protein n=1 Tax=Thelazia callipaeda TaxID=103827 RepID=A0A0N5CTK0_THECL|nr:unnamed protein product [Thelazia callipaeda]